MKSLLSTLVLVALAGPAFAGDVVVPEPGGISAVAGVIGALIALKALRK
jgi:hypothetical protein